MTHYPGLESWSKSSRLGHASEEQSAVALGLLDRLWQESQHAGLGRPGLRAGHAQSEALESHGAGEEPFDEAWEAPPWRLILPPMKP